MPDKKQPISRWMRKPKPKKQEPKPDTEADMRRCPKCEKLWTHDPQGGWCSCGQRIEPLDSTSPHPKEPTERGKAMMRAVDEVLLELDGSTLTTLQKLEAAFVKGREYGLREEKNSGVQREGACVLCGTLTTDQPLDVCRDCVGKQTRGLLPRSSQEQSEAERCFENGIRVGLRLARRNLATKAMESDTEPVEQEDDRPTCRCCGVERRYSCPECAYCQNGHKGERCSACGGSGGRWEKKIPSTTIGKPPMPPWWSFTTCGTCGGSGSELDPLEQERKKKKVWHEKYLEANAENKKLRAALRAGDDLADAVRRWEEARK